MVRFSGDGGNGNPATIMRSASFVRNQDEADIAHYIVVGEGSAYGNKLEIGLTPVGVGRQDDNDLSLADPFVSSHHCTIRFEEGQIWVTDLDSTNGTFIEGKRVEGRAVWPVGAALEVGNQVLRHEYRPRVEVQRSDQLTQELQDAAAYVQSLLPHPLSRGSVRANWYFLPSSVLGGDIFDYFWLNADHFVFYLLDVSGHGIGAALHSVSVFNLLRQQLRSDLALDRPAQVLCALNEALPMERYGDMYFTVWYGVYQPRNRTLAFASAGHPPALLFDGVSQRRTDLLTPNPPIGMLAGSDYQEMTTTLSPGGRIYLYSDGVYEITTERGEPWSWTEFAQLVEDKVQKCIGKSELVFHQIRSMAKANRFDDDFSLLVLSFLEKDSP